MGLQTRRPINLHRSLGLSRKKLIAFFIIFIVIFYCIGFAMGVSSATSVIATIGYKIIKQAGYEGFVKSSYDQCLLHVGGQLKFFDEIQN